MFRWPQSSAYTITSLILWMSFLAAIFGTAWGKHNGWPDLVLWTLAIIPALTVIIQTITAYKLISKQDEFIRALTAKRMLAAIGATLTAAVAYAPFQQFLNAPEIPVWFVYPLFWGLFGVMSGVLRDGGHA